MALNSELQRGEFLAFTNAIGGGTGSGGGVDTDVMTVEAIDRTASGLVGDKVLVESGYTGGQKFTTDIFSSKSTIEAKGWYDDNTIIGSFLNKENRRIRYIDDTWQEEVLDSMKPKTGNTCNFFWTTNNGKVISKNWFTYILNSDSGQEYFISEEGFSIVNTTACSIYLGEYNGVHYGCKGKTCAIYVYNPATSTYDSTALISNTSNRNNCFLEGDKILTFIQNSNRDYKVYQLTDNGGYTTLKSDGRLSNSYGILRILGVTGLEIGDYVLALDDGDTTTTDPKTLLWKLTFSNACKLVIMQIQEGYTLVPVSLPGLEQFETVDCRISYDRRNKVLMIGTKLGVFAYQFNSDTKTFSEIPLGLGLPEIVMGSVYCPYMSPNKKRILVTLPMSGVVNDAGSYAEKVWIYQLSEEGEWFIVDNRTLNYQPNSTYTGKVVESLGNGKHRVKIIS